MKATPRKRRLARSSILFVGLVAACGGGTSGGSGDGPGPGEMDVYAGRIQPILDSACSCHTPDNPVGGYTTADTPYLALFSQGLVSRGSPEDSLLLTSMSIEEWNQYFTGSQIDVLSEWIRIGAPRYASPEGLGTGAATVVGAGACTVCHARVTPEWLQGAHGNLETMSETHQPLDLGLNAQGFPPYGYHGLGAEPECTLVCHDPLGDGNDLVAGYTGNVPRPVVGCESCHGPGSNHFGAGPIPYERPDPARCGRCHNATVDHNRYHPESDHIFEDYAVSPHARSINDHTYVEEESSDVRPTCSKCHTDEGAKAFRTVDGGHDDLGEAPEIAGAQPLTETTPVQCRTCHQAHRPEELLEPSTVDDMGTVTESSEYRTCTNCHQIADGYHGEDSKYSWSGYELNVGAFSGDSIIYDTHFDNGTAPAGVRESTTIEGYVLDPADERACRDCHNVHASDNTINRQWARSAHGGHILDAKEAAAADPANDGTAAVLTAGVTDEYGAAWSHYDFKDPSRASCQYCHTATGFRNFVSDPESYDPEGNDFTAAGSQRELLYCWACHPDNAGNVYDPGALSLTYQGGEDPTAYPDLTASNVCITCHAGRQSGKTVAVLDSNGLADLRFPNPHYLAASGVLFRTIGYEFAQDASGQPLDYSDVEYFAHATIGTTAVAPETEEIVQVHPGTGTSGPCVGCHMSLDPAAGALPEQDAEEEEAGAGAPAGGTAAGQAARDPAAHHGMRPMPSKPESSDTEIAFCAHCHEYVDPDRDYRMTPAIAQEEKAHFEDALEALRAQAAQRGFHYYDSYPYLCDAPGLEVAQLYGHAVKNWYTDTDSDGFSALDTDGDGTPDAADPEDAWTGMRNLGACFNLTLLKHEPGAFAHNRYYTKRLIYDSIDWLDDNALNGSVDATLSALADDTPYKAGARSYLGTERP